MINDHFAAMFFLFENVPGKSWTPIFYFGCRREERDDDINLQNFPGFRCKKDELTPYMSIETPYDFIEIPKGIKMIGRMQKRYGCV